MPKAARAARTAQSAGTAKPVHARERLRLGQDPARIVAVADTHGRPHPALGARLDELAPAHVLHAGDVGDLGVLRELAKHAPVTAVRGNIDGRELPDFVTLALELGAEGAQLNVLLTHIAVYGPMLRADVAKVARAEDASLVVCGHSHVPFATSQRGITVFNPGSCGPRRFQLPIVLGVIEFAGGRASVRHVDCETGLPWAPSPR